MIRRGNLPEYGVIPEKDRNNVCKLRNDFFDFRKELLKQRQSQLGLSSTDRLFDNLPMKPVEEEKDPFNNI